MIYGYNFKNQLLNPGKLAEILDQANYGYNGQLSGVIGNTGDVVTFTNDSEGQGVSFVVSGNTVSITSDETQTLQNNSLLILRVYRSDYQTVTSIENDNVRAEFALISGVTAVEQYTIEGEPIANFYRVVTPSHTYITGYVNKTSQYIELPIYVKFNNNCTKISTYIDKTDYKSFLSQDAVTAMWADIEQRLASYLMDSDTADTKLSQSTDSIRKLPIVSTKTATVTNPHILSNGVWTACGQANTSAAIEAAMKDNSVSAPIGSLYFQIV